ncbi:MAG: hypothetical protein IPL83_02775 [Bdellovibrionales bacterium]|nr:hypothetical protein [Bdellovibrionales bacterium]
MNKHEIMISQGVVKSLLAPLLETLLLVSLTAPQALAGQHFFMVDPPHGPIQSTCGRLLGAHLGIPPERGYFRRLFSIHRRPLKEMTILKKQRILQGGHKPSNMNSWTNLASADAVILIVHQMGHLQDESARRLREDPQFHNMPRWVITSDRFFLKSKDLFDEATALYYSEGGEFSLDFKASKVHFMGGFCGLCLFTATLHALEATMKSGTDLNFYFHLGAIYSESEFGSKESIDSWIQKLISIASWKADVLAEEINDEAIRVSINGPNGQRITIHFLFR